MNWALCLVIYIVWYIYKEAYYDTHPKTNTKRRSK
jgi:hypothetical protein